MSTERIDATLRLFTAAEGGFDRVPAMDAGFRTILGVGGSRVVCELIAGELAQGEGRPTSWKLIAPIDRLTPEEMIELFEGARGTDFGARDFESFLPGAQLSVSDSFAIVGMGTINRRYRAEHDENAV